jgi:hypothetical protein
MVIDRNANATFKDLIIMKKDLEWKKSLVSVQTGKDLAHLLKLEMPKSSVDSKKGMDFSKIKSGVY